MNALASDPRTLATDFRPDFASVEEGHRYLIGMAALAPSTFNTQPWLFEVREDNIALIPDRARQLQVIDPDGREMVISCGAALANLVVAGRYAGFEVDLDRNGHASLGRHPLARLRMVRTSPPRNRDEQLFHAIPRRHTIRHSFNQRGISDLQMRRLLDAMESTEASARVVDEPDMRTQLATLAQSNLIEQSLQTERSQEANRWRLPRDSRRRDGVPQAALGMSMQEYLWYYLSGGVSGVTRKAGQALHRKAAKCSRLLVITTPKDDIHHWLEAGYAMERALLRAAAIGIQASFMGALTYAPEAREKTRKVIRGRGIPQLVLCLGHSDSRPATPRRPVEHLIRNT